MGGYKTKLKEKIKSKWKEKFSSGSKLEEQSASNQRTSDAPRSNEQRRKEPPLVQRNNVRALQVDEKATRGTITETGVINDNSIMKSFKNDSIAPFLPGQDKNLTQKGETGNSWKQAKPTINQDMIKKMAADANSTNARLHKVESAETERFNAGHLFLKEYLGIESYQKYSMNYYYTIMNTLARKGKPPKTVMVNGQEVTVTEKDVQIAIAAMKDMSQDMNEGPHSQLQEDRTVYRGVGDFFIDNLRKQLGIANGVTDEELNRRLKGAIFFDRAFTSTSLNPDVAEDFATHNSGKNGKKEATILQIHAPKGLKAQYIAPISKYKGEAELLVDQNTPLRILDVVTEVDPKTGIKYRLVKAEFLSFYAGSHRARMSNDYDLQDAKDNHLKKQGSIPQVSARISSRGGSGSGTLFNVAGRKVT